MINAVVWNDQERLLDSPYRLEDFRLLPGVAEAVRRMHEMGFLAVVVSNQPGVAKGKCTFEYVDEVTRKMHHEFALQGTHLDQVYYCYHHPAASFADLRIECDCRKPKPGLLLRGCRELAIDPNESYMIGDQERDVEAGRAAGCTTILVRLEDCTTSAHLTASSLPQAVELIALRTAAKDYDGRSG